MKHSICLLLFFVITCKVNAQQYTQVISSPDLDSLVEQHIASNTSNPVIPGYRIQIFFGSERKAANDAKTKFLQEYPDASAYLVYQQPYFKVRVGDFRTHLEAQSIFQKILQQFDNVFIVPDKINLPKL